jgi:hypothetical protein
MSVSIIISTFNGASRIGNCLDALLKQTHNCDTEILVVNDGSTLRPQMSSPVTRVFVSSIRQNAGPAEVRD